MCHTFLVVTVKIWLKSVYIYGSYSKIKTGVPLFWTTLYAKFGMKYLSVTSSVATSGHTGGHVPTRCPPWWAHAHHDPPMLGHKICADLKFFGGVGKMEDGFSNKPAQKNICQLQTVCTYLASPHRSSAPGPHWGTSVPKPHVPTLTSEPVYATVSDTQNIQQNLSQSRTTSI